MAPSEGGGPQRNRKPAYKHPNSLKRKRDEQDLEKLSQQVTDLDTNPGTTPTLFTDFPISSPTLKGLKDSHFETLTTIQTTGIPPSLKGVDILGAAKTGSGKTLAFLVPVLENLYRKRWTEYDGLGALILSPTRELSIQIFEVLRKVGRHHTFSAGLVIGGKSLQEERARLGRMNILVATPGRMLQHMDQTADFEIGNLQMLVLDEADRIMDMGFKDTVDAIIEHLPPDRQTLMFSATQTKKVSDLARLSLKDPEFVSVHQEAESATPATLQQNYVVTPLPEKLDTLWSFLRANLKKKILVFLSSGKQVRFVYEAFRHMQPGVPLLHLHGRQKQTARFDITTKFSRSKYVCLFSTDVTARGLDFPAVDWVVQLDCPEDADTYIHRVGRTARYEHDGRAILFVDPSEEKGMLEVLKKKKVSLEEITIRQSKMQNSIRSQLQNMCFKDPELKYLGQKAFISYVRSIYVQQNKDIFKLKELNLDEFAASLGLPGAPRVKFIKGEDAKRRKNAPRHLLALSDSEKDEAAPQPDKPAVRTKYDRMFERRNQDVLADHYTRLIEGEEGSGEEDRDSRTADADEDNEFLAVRRRFDAGDIALGQDLSTSNKKNGENDISRSLPEKDEKPIRGIKKIVHLSNKPDETLLIDSKRREKLLKSKKKLLKFKSQGTHMHFDENDEPHEAEYYEREEEFTRKGEPEMQREAFLAAERQRTNAADMEDKSLAKQKRREKREKRKAREREEDDGREPEERLAYLAPYDEGSSRLEDGDLGSFADGKEKRQKKWFEDESEGDEPTGVTKIRRKKRKAMGVDEPQTLEDLEALATGLLAR